MDATGITNLQILEDQIQIINVGAIPGSDAFLIRTGERAVLIDSGFSFCAHQMIANIKGVLGERPLDDCLLTHSHYDHASGSAYLREHFPDVRIWASSHAARILQKPSAILVMREMNRAAAEDYGYREEADQLDQLRVDHVCKEGDCISLGAQTLEVLDAPGHTKCSVAFYMPEARFLIACETMGVYVGDSAVAPCYLVGYGQSMDFIKRVAELNPEHILIPHYGVLSGEECRRYIENAGRCGEELKNLIVSEYEKGTGLEGILAAYKTRFYTKNLRRIQPEKAFDLNAGYLVPMVLREMGLEFS